MIETDGKKNVNRQALVLRQSLFPHHACYSLLAGIERVQNRHSFLLSVSNITCLLKLRQILHLFFALDTSQAASSSHGNATTS